MRTLKCPNCGSENVTLWMGGKLGMIYLCKHCGFKGPIIIEEEIDD
jgi:predicted RNA-binding Zn-ribbon protein involved in translation (DUF1610 family)